MGPDMQKQKQEKKQNLIDASYILFTGKGFSKTSIDEIVKMANVAKGTFYLYFKDKSDIMEEVVLQISCKLLKSAYIEMKSHSIPNFIDKILFIVDYIIEYFRKNQQDLKMVQRNFSWPLVREKLATNDDKELALMLDECFYNPYMNNRSKEDAYKMMFIIIELVGSICYTSILKQHPAPIDEMKPFLFNTIGKLLQ